MMSGLGDLCDEYSKELRKARETNRPIKEVEALEYKVGQNCPNYDFYPVAWPYGWNWGGWGGGWGGHRGHRGGHGGHRGHRRHMHGLGFLPVAPPISPLVTRSVIGATVVGVAAAIAFYYVSSRKRA
jgi:hypothetical protein